ncbi:MAG: hypothetical protein CSA07_05020 [Bacteroidia bacterium]|nr:MAG: hypothetical protein CSA07_05020 [Bacteroidia bacterium]
MKIVRAIEHVGQQGYSGVGYVPLLCADTARVNRGEAVYLAHPEHAYSLTPCLYARLRGVCKSVDGGQAECYVEALGLALHLCDETLRDALRRDGLPWTSAVSFDRAIVAGEPELRLADLPPGPESFALRVGAEERRGGGEPLAGRLLSTISGFSRVLSFNTGDWLLLPLMPPAGLVSLPARVQLTLGGHLLLDEHIR